MAEESVSYERFQQKVQEVQELKNKIADLESKQSESAKVERVATKHAERIVELEAQLNSTRHQHEMALTMSDMGLTDPEIRETVEWQYGKLQGEDRPAFGEWLGGIKENPDQAPAVLRPFLSKPAPSPEPEAKPAPTTTRQPLPNPDNGARQVAGAPAGYTAQSIKNMSLAEFAQAMPALDAAIPSLGLRASAYFPKGGDGNG